MESAAGATVPGDDMLAGAVDGEAVDGEVVEGGVVDGDVIEGDVAGDDCCALGVVFDGVWPFIIAPGGWASPAEGVVLVCADTKPTVPTIVAAAMAEIRVLEAFIVESP